MYKIINNNTSEIMEHINNKAEALVVLAQYNEMGKDSAPDSEYFGTYRIEAA